MYEHTLYMRRTIELAANVPEVVPSQHGSTIRQTAIFEPRGLGGLFYWYGIYPLHQFGFAGMLINLARAATVEKRKDVE